MTREHMDERREPLAGAFAASDASTRLRAAMAAGTHPRAGDIETLVQRCAVEPDFGVREMLTWALTRAEREVTVNRLLRELTSEVAQARSQALHTLSKLGEPRTWPAITMALLADSDDQVARAAWRAATALVPDGERGALAEALATQLGRGDREVRLSLSRAFVALREAATPVLERARASREVEAAAHAVATLRLIANPDEGFDAAIEQARRAVALRAAPRPSPC